MVLTVTAPLWSDISDRQARALGQVYATRRRFNDLMPLTLDDMENLNTVQWPWWVYALPGRLLDMDDFEGTLRWEQIVPTVSKASDPKYVHSGTSAMKMATAAAVGDSTYAQRIFAGPDMETRALSIDMWWCLSAVAATTPRAFAFQLSIEDHYLNTSSVVGLKYVHYNAGGLVKRLYYWSSAGAWAMCHSLVGPIDVIKPFFNFFQLQLTRSPTTGYKYFNAWHNDRSSTCGFDTPQMGAFAAARHVVDIWCETDVAAVTTAYVDDFVLCVQSSTFI